MSKYASLMIGAAILMCAGQANAAGSGVKVGVLTCQVESGWGFVIGSSKDMQCVYRPIHGVEDRYSGSIFKLGLDLGYTDSGTIVWDVVAPASDVGPGALQGSYGGATASATVLAGVGANVLIGGFDKSVALQPISVLGNSGIDVSAGIGAIHLREIVPERAPPRVSEVTPPQQVPQRDQVFKVYFGFDNDELTPESRAVVSDAAESILTRHNRTARVMVFGNTDTAGDYRYNDALSDRRAAAVRAELIRDGLDPEMVGAAGHAYDDPDVGTAPGVPEQLNRRAIIVVRSGSDGPAG